MLVFNEFLLTRNKGVIHLDIGDLSIVFSPNEFNTWSSLYILTIIANLHQGIVHEIDDFVSWAKIWIWRFCDKLIIYKQIHALIPFRKWVISKSVENIWRYFTRNYNPPQGDTLAASWIKKYFRSWLYSERRSRYPSDFESIKNVFKT